jgi:error-prone DNA polymerase
VSQTPGTAKGFSFLTLEDEEGMINVVLRPQIYKRYRHVVRLEPFLLVEGRVERREGVTNIMAERIAALRIEE